MECDSGEARHLPTEDKCGPPADYADWILYVRFGRCAPCARAFGREEGDFFSTFVRGLTPTAKTNAALRARVFAA